MQIHYTMCTQHNTLQYHHITNPTLITSLMKVDHMYTVATIDHGIHHRNQSTLNHPINKWHKWNSPYIQWSQQGILWENAYILFDWNAMLHNFNYVTTHLQPYNDFHIRYIGTSEDVDMLPIIGSNSWTSVLCIWDFSNELYSFHVI